MELNIENASTKEKGISGHKIQITNGYVKINHITFWGDNPRIYSLLDDERLDKTLDRDIIFNKLRRTKDFDNLLQQIKIDGSINEPIWVGKDADTGDHVVYEGNTRLAVAKVLRDGGDKRFSKIEINQFPEDTPLKYIKKFVGDAHLKGKNKWNSYEKYGWMYREIMSYKNISKETISKSISQIAKDYSETRSQIQKCYDLVNFMEENKITSAARKEFISYWEEIIKSSPIKQVRKDFKNEDNLNSYNAYNNFDEMIIKKVKEGIEVKRAAAGSVDGNFRQDIKLIGEAYTKHGKDEHIHDLLNGKITLQAASRIAESQGAGDKDYSDVKNFADWISDRKVKIRLRSSVKKYPDIDIKLRDINIAIKEIRLSLKKHLENAQKIK
tara:strand:+ start:3526 stop:4677 length:1152 start_codon:yes stop_codon:yes gene_type:complete